MKEHRFGLKGPGLNFMLKLIKSQAQKNLGLKVAELNELFSWLETKLDPIKLVKQVYSGLKPDKKEYSPWLGLVKA